MVCFCVILLSGCAGSSNAASRISVALPVTSGRLFTRFDANADGTLTHAEFAECRAALLANTTRMLFEAMTPARVLAPVHVQDVMAELVGTCLCE